MDSQENKVAFFLPQLAFGGAEKNFVRLANEFADKGMSVTFIVLFCGGAFVDKLSPKVRLISLTSYQESNLLSVVLGLFRFMSTLRKERYAFLLSTLTGANLFSIVALCIGCLKRKTKLLLREANTVENYQHSRFKFLAAKYLYPLADQIIAVSPDVMFDMKNIFKINENKLRLIPNPVDSLQLSEEHVTSSPLVLAVGRLVPQKGFDVLISAFARLDPEIRGNLVIAGEGSSRLMLENLVDELGVGDCVSLPGYVENPFKAFERAWLVVVPSRFEGMPNVTLEAMQRGFPIVTTRHRGGVWLEEVKSKLEYVDVDDVDALGASIEKCISPNRERRVYYDLGQLSPDKIVDEYSMLMREFSNG